MKRRRQSALDHFRDDSTIIEGAEDHRAHVERANSFTSDANLRFSQTRTVLIGDLIPSPYNKVFEHLKTKEYYDELRHDIEAAGAITDPLITLKDGTVVSGHSRLQIAKELLESGNEHFRRVPVRTIENALTDDEIKKRVYRSNLARFEIDADTRVLLHANLYPDFYKPSKLPRRTENESQRNTAERVAEDSGISKRQIANERRLYQDALLLAKQQGREEPLPADIAEIRKQVNNTRRNRKREVDNKTREQELPTASHGQSKAIPAQRSAPRSETTSQPEQSPSNETRHPVQKGLFEETDPPHSTPFSAENLSENSVSRTVSNTLRQFLSEHDVDPPTREALSAFAERLIAILQN